MTDTVNHKIKALELANQHLGEKPGDTVARANAYHAFLAGPAAAGAAVGGAANNKPSAGAAGATNKTTAGTAGGAKSDAEKAADKAAATAAAKAAAAKANTAKTPAAGAAGNKPAAGATATANAGAPPADTKAPGGKYTYADVVSALRQVKDKSSKEDAIAILVEDGGGAKSVRDLKPALYDAVVEACNNTLNGDGAPDATAGSVEDPTAQPERDELGLEA